MLGAPSFSQDTASSLFFNTQVKIRSFMIVMDDCRRCPDVTDNLQEFFSPSAGLTAHNLLTSHPFHNKLKTSSLTTDEHSMS